MKKINSLFIFLLFAYCLSAQTEVIMNVGITKRQEFKGSGASLTDHIDLIPEGARKVMSAMTFKDFNMNTLRMWNWGGNTFDNQYVATRAIEFATKDGVTNLLLGPGNGINAPADMTAYANGIALRIKNLKDATGFLINVTGVANEPDNWTSAHLGDGISKIRTALDANGLSMVKIVGPESSNCDDHWYNIMVGVKNTNPTAWGKLDYIASHSYNMCATEKWAQFSFSNNKDYWMTESANDGVDSETNDNEATSLAARFINDMNHGVVNWVYFIAYSSDMGNTMTKLLSYDAVTGKIFMPCKYFYMKQVYTTFKSGSVFRKVLANGTGEMDQTYNNKSPYNAAVAQNTDGTWSIAVINGTGIQGFSATPYKFTFNMPELASAVAIDFKVLRTNLTRKMVDDGIVTMTNGKLSIVINAKEVVTLTTGNIQPHIPITSFSIDPQLINLGLRASLTLTPTITPANATIKGIIWKSSNSGFVKVDDSGVITAMVPGTATITATTAEGSKVATCTVNVRLENKLNGTWSSSGASAEANDESKVFDADFTTYFNSTMADNAWVGVDFGAERTISTVKMSPRIGFADRMIGGKIQASNTPDFSNPTDLLTVNKLLTENIQNIFINTDNTAFRYVRYLSPVGGFGNVSELQFWTDPKTALITPTDLEFEVFPNPIINGNVTVKLGDFKNEQNVQIRIIDINGKDILLRKLNSQDLNNESITINRSNFISGIYQVSISTDKGSKTLKLIVK